MLQQSKTLQIKTVHSESQIQQGIIANFKRNRVIEQTACYLGKGADLYYSPDRPFLKYDYPKIAQLLKNILDQKKGGKSVIVSLACGDCKVDKGVLECLQNMGHDICFFGVDSSMSMLYKAADVLNDASFESHLICADFGVSGFREELDKIIGDYDTGIYLFFGGTIGNLNQGYVTDILRGILSENDYMLLDVGGFETINTLTQSKLFERYKGYLNNPAEMEFFLGPLESLGVPKDHGKLTLEITKDSATQAQVFTFGFKVHTIIKIDLDREEVNLTPNEYIYLFKVLIYDLGELIKFLETKRFKLKQQIVGEYMNQLILQKQ